LSKGFTCLEPPAREWNALAHLPHGPTNLTSSQCELKLKLRLSKFSAKIFQFLFIFFFEIMLKNINIK
jgi:hypothetical protein